MAEGESNDRELLRERVRARLEATDRSQRQLESELGWSSGTLTRVFGGRKQLDGVMLVQLAEALGVSAASLVEGTALASLVEVLPEAPPAEEAATAAPSDATPVGSIAPEPATAPEPAKPEPTTEPEPDVAAPAPTPAAAGEARAGSETETVRIVEAGTETRTVRAAAPEADAEAETEAIAGRVAPEDAPTEVDRRAAAGAEAPAPPPADNGAAPPEEAPAGTSGGVRGWLRSIARRVFGGSRQG